MMTQRKTYGWMLACVLGAALPRAQAQSVESDLTPDTAGQAVSTTGFAVPEPGDKFLSRFRLDGEHDRWSAKFGIVLLPADYTTFDQDANSKLQVGNQQDEFEARSLRLMVRGHYELWRKWNYMFSYEYKGFDKNPGDPDWSATDLRLSTDINGVGTLMFGKIKEPFVYEMVGDAANLPHAERLLSPFFISRNEGVHLSNTMFEERGTWAVGWYNDWFVDGGSFQDAGNDFAARVTALPVWTETGDRYLHLAASVRYYGGADDKLRFRGRPASNVADNYVDTGNIEGDHAWNTGLEALVNMGPYSVLAEYVNSSVSSDATGDPDFKGYYVTATWIVTGEHRPYDRKVAYTRRVQPQGRWGAWELVARYGRADLNDGAVDGGDMEGWWAGVNWWASRRWRATITYGDIDLDRDGMTGNTKTFLSRIQWIY